MFSIEKFEVDDIWSRDRKIVTPDKDFDF
jgi:hypothetical protein